MLSQARPALAATLLFTIVLGLAYPLTVTGLGQLAFPGQAGGSLVRNAGGTVIGSALIAQPFTRPEYLHPRPSAAGANGYDAAGSSGSNLGPMSEDLGKRVGEAAAALRAEGAGAIPADAVTTSGSGLDPDVSPANADRQVARVAAARGVAPEAVRRIIAANTESAWLWVFGQPRVNVLRVNLALDAAHPAPARPNADPAPSAAIPEPELSSHPAAP